MSVAFLSRPSSRFIACLWGKSNFESATKAQDLLNTRNIEPMPRKKWRIENLSFTTTKNAGALAH